MIGKYDYCNINDKDGNPAGGEVHGKGLMIKWQDGTLGRGKDRIEPNGAFVETVINAAKQRIKYYQDSMFNCIENAVAIKHLNLALEALTGRTLRREKQGTEGTHKGN